VTIEPEAASYSVERFVPGDGGPIIAYEHVHRYAACADVVRGRRVLDVASGEGYGAALLARTAASVTGVDIDDAAVSAARARYGGDGLEFSRADMYELPFGDGSFDVVTCFEAIEHVDAPGRALDEIARVLSEDGTVVISTPDKAVYSDAADYENEFHLHEFYRDEFCTELNKRFAFVTLLGQRTRAGSELVVVDPRVADAPPTVDYFPDAGTTVSPPLYLIAVCRNRELRRGAPDVRPGVLLDGTDELVDGYIAAVHAAMAPDAQAAARLEQRDRDVADLNIELVGARAYAAEMSRQYEIAAAKGQALSDELLRVTRESEQRAVHLLAAEDQLTALGHGAREPDPTNPSS
jgi:SAM-dependent methyltransferase